MAEPFTPAQEARVRELIAEALSTPGHPRRRRELAGDALRVEPYEPGAMLTTAAYVGREPKPPPGEGAPHDV